MYIIVRQKDHVIVGTAVNYIDEVSVSASGCKVYELPDEEFDPSLLGKKLESFERE